MKIWSVDCLIDLNEQLVSFLKKKKYRIRSLYLKQVTKSPSVQFSRFFMVLARYNASIGVLYGISNGELSIIAFRNKFDAASDIRCIVTD